MFHIEVSLTASYLITHFLLNEKETSLAGLLRGHQSDGVYSEAAAGSVTAPTFCFQMLQFNQKITEEELFIKI